MRSRANKLRAVAWWAVWFAGCGAVGIDNDTAAPRCTADSDCGANLRCIDQTYCVAAVATAQQVAVRLTPPQNSGKLVEHFELDVDAKHQTEPATLMLSEPAVVAVMVKAGDTQLLTPGTLVASAPGDVFGASLRFEATKVFERASGTSGSGKVFSRYELRLQPGKTYDLAFQPEAADKVPPHFGTVTVGGSIANWTIDLPKESDLIRVRGKIRAGGVALGGLAVFVSNSDGQVTSTRQVTDAAGAFEVLTEASAVAGLLYFEPNAAKLALPRGHLTTPVDVQKAAKDPAKGLDLGVIDVGAMPPPVAVTLTVNNADQQPEVGALVRVQSLLQPPNAAVLAYVDVHGFTDAAGQFGAAMPGGPLKASVLPSAASHASLWSGKIKAQQGTQVVQCGRRPTATGTVKDYAGRPVRGARVWMRRVAKPDDASGESFSGPGNLGDVPIETTTDDAGAFAMLADAGGWWLWVQPKQADLLPRVLAAKVHLGAGEGGDASVAVTVPAPVLLLGRVVAASGAAVAGTSIDVMTLLAKPQPRQQSGDPAKGAPVDAASVWADSHLLGSAVADSSGQFAVLLAPPPP